MEHHYLSRRVSMDTFNRNFYNSDYVMTPEEAQRTQKPYRYGMILLCFGALINWIGLAENYTDPFRYAGVACIIGGAFLICTAMCCWLHVPNRSAVGVSETDDNDAIHVITVADPPTTEKPPEYDTVVILEPPCYDDAIKLNPANLLKTKYYQDVSLPNYADLEICEQLDCSTNNNNSLTMTTTTTTTTSTSTSVPTTTQNQDNSQQNDSVTTSQPTNNTNTNTNTNNLNNNNNNQQNELNVTNSCSNRNSNDNAFTVITIDQTASNSLSQPDHSITEKSTDCDSVASESIAMS